MLTGKAVAPDVRGHLIVDFALNAILYSAALGAPVDTSYTNYRYGLCPDTLLLE